MRLQGWIQDYKLGGGGHLKKLCQEEGGAKIFEVFRVKNHDFMPKNHIFSNSGLYGLRLVLLMLIVGSTGACSYIFTSPGIC